MIDDAVVLERSLELFVRHGIKRTSLERIAATAGTTRVTLYRRFSDKKTLVREALLHAVCRFDEELGGLAVPGDEGLEGCLEGFARLYSEGLVGTLGGLREELARLYPSLFREVLEAQHAAGRDFFRRLVDAAGKTYHLRSEADPELLSAVFETLLRHMPEDPSLQREKREPGELFARTARLLLFGIADTS